MVAAPFGLVVLFMRPLGGERPFGTGSVFAIVSLIQRRLTGQIAGMAGA